MANKTANDVITKALRRMNVIAKNAAASGDDYEEALSEYKGFHEWMLKEFTRTVSWNYDAVPEEYHTHVAGWLAGELLGVFPCGAQTTQRVEAWARRSETRLREMLARRSIKTVEIEYY